MRKASDSTQLIRLRKERDQLRRSNHTLTIERQGYALRAKIAECMLLDLRGEISKLTQRFDAFLGVGTQGVAEALTSKGGKDEKP